jgi:polysaccharide chain length determinant protein (PEP-CTERM system associated)
MNRVDALGVAVRDFSKLSIEDVIGILWKRRWYIVLSPILVGALGAAYAWNLPPIYRSATTVLVESQFVPEDYVRSTVRDTTEERINSVNQQLRSRSFLERIIEDLRLYGFGTKGFLMEAAVDRMRNQMDIVWWRNTFVIGFRSVQPELARDVTRRLANDLIEMNDRSRKNQAIETDEFIDVELRQRGGELAAHEEKLRAFKTAHLGELPDQVTANLEALNRLQAQLSSNENALQRAQSQRTSLERSIDTQARRKAFDSPVPERTLPIVAPRPESSEVAGLRAKLSAKTEQLDEARGRYTSKHPQVAKLTRETEQLEEQLREAIAAAKLEASTVASEASAASQQAGRNESGSRSEGSSDVAESTGLGLQLEGLRNEISALQKEREYLISQVRMHENRRLGAPRVEQELFALTREHEALKQQHRDLQQKKYNTQVAANLETNANNQTLKVIDEAYLPEKPVGPERRKIALIGLVAGLMVGLVIVVGLESTSVTIGNENQAAQELGLPILVSIPRMSAKELGLQRKLQKVGSGRQVLPL